MARVPMVTRTIQSTEVVVLCLNIKTAEPFNKVVTLPRTYKEEKLLKAVQAQHDNADEKCVAVVSSKVVEKVYGMLETDFIAHATELDPETRKVLEAEETKEQDKEPEAPEAPATTKTNKKTK